MYYVSVRNFHVQNGSHPFRPQAYFDPGNTSTPGTLRPREHFDPESTSTPGTLQPQEHFDPRNTSTLGILRPQIILNPKVIWVKMFYKMFVMHCLTSLCPHTFSLFVVALICIISCSVYRMQK